MSFVPIVFGKKDWDKEYEQSAQYNSLYCPNCHNYSVRPVKRREFIAFWFIPLFPIFFGKQLVCPVCNWRQDFKNEEQLQKVVREQANIQQGKVGS
ncbi:LADA_0D02388g1_1 [Lachancea dasiensis]|uniref:LADA_0D02388g1_1 n=1 Tax=Lachancea dasiensis TaxID=1072105 RepID=A0A1G4J4K5_9SACH|nr:LADA_0D02388g1_1 [Lachancea dasiensis]